MEANAEALARYAAISQQAGLVPIVEPEVLMAGDFTIQRSMEAHIAAYSVLFQKLALHKVDLAGLVLKASMVVCGDKKGKATPEEVGEGELGDNLQVSNIIDLAVFAHSYYPCP
jgi:fructose-bisphosphate aldolase class I